MIRKIFHSGALLCLGAALLAVLADCAKSVALTQLSFTYTADFLSFLGLSVAKAAPPPGSAAYILCRLLSFAPLWAAFLAPAWLFYRLARLQPHLPLHWRYKIRQFSQPYKV